MIEKIFYYGIPTTAALLVGAVLALRNLATNGNMNDEFLKEKLSVRVCLFAIPGGFVAFTLALLWWWR